MRVCMLAAMALLALAGTAVAADGGAVAPTPTLTVAATDGVVNDGDPVRVGIDPKGAAGPFALTARDADGGLVAEMTLSLSPETARMEVTVPAVGRRWVNLRLADPAAPERILAERSVAILRPAPAADRRFGFNARPDLAPLVRRLGGCWVRGHIPWEQEGEGKPFAGKGIEKTIAPVRAAGCEVFGISNYSLPWASVYAAEDTRPMREFFSPPRPAAWDAYIRDVAPRLAGQVPAFEVWNEPNFDQFWRSTPDTFAQRIQDYSELLKRTRAILREGAPGVLVTNGSLVDTRNSSAHAFLRAIIEKGCAESFDVLNIHYYNSTRPPERLPPPAADAKARDRSLETYLEGFRQIQAEFKITKPVWMTEIGWPTVDPGGWGTVSELDQARFLVRSHVLCFAAGVEAVMWFQLEGKDFGVWEPERGPKPAFAAYAQLVQALRGKAFRRWVGEGSARAALFGGTDEAVIVAWALEPAEWPLPPGAKVTRAESLLGESRPLPDGHAVKLDPSPVYLFMAPGAE